MERAMEGAQLADTLQTSRMRQQLWQERQAEQDKMKRIEAVMQQNKDDPGAGIDAARGIDWNIGTTMREQYDKASQERQIRVATLATQELTKRREEGGIIAEALMGLRDPSTGQWVPERLPTVRSTLERAVLSPAWLPKEWDPAKTPQVIEAAIRGVATTRKELDAEIERRRTLVALEPGKSYTTRERMDQAAMAGGAAPSPVFTTPAAPSGDAYCVPAGYVSAYRAEKQLAPDAPLSLAHIEDMNKKYAASRRDSSSGSSRQTADPKTVSNIVKGIEEGTLPPVVQGLYSNTDDVLSGLV